MSRGLPAMISMHFYILKLAAEERNRTQFHKMQRRIRDRKLLVGRADGVDGQD